MRKHRKHFITLICLVVGMLVLTTAVYANYDDAKGYTNYKNALKYLAFEADNFSAEYDMKIKMDGENMQSASGNYKCADGDNSQYSKHLDSYDDKTYNYEDYSYENGDKFYSYNPKTNEYYQGNVYHDGNNSFMGTDDATSKKAVRFAELLADTLVGDLKNNVILESSKDGIKKYSIHVAGNQIPEIVNAGLSLAFTASNSEDYDNEITSKFGNEPYIDKVNFKVTLNEDGRLLENNMEATLAGVDKNGNKHTATMELNAEISDYNNTTVDVFNPEGKERLK